MSFSRPIQLKDRIIGADQEPLICAPLVGPDEEAVRRELAAIVPKAPDLIEWRVDFFEGIAELQRVLALSRTIRENAAGIPIIFTRRSIREGGNPIALDEEQVLAMAAAVCRAGSIDLLDYELSVGEGIFTRAVALAKETGVRLIASFHRSEERRVGKHC